MFKKYVERIKISLRKRREKYQNLSAEEKKARRRKRLLHCLIVALFLLAIGVAIWLAWPRDENGDFTSLSITNNESGQSEKDQSAAESKTDESQNSDEKAGGESAGGRWRNCGRRWQLWRCRSERIGQ